MANYLYNGVELPDVYSADLHGLDAHHYLIYKNGGSYFLVCCVNPIAYRTGYGVVGSPFTGSVFNRYRFYPGAVNQNWSLYGTSAALNLDDSQIGEYIWTSHDILYENSTDIFLPRTDPILVPDTETVEPLDPTALLMGYRVGCALRAQRGKQ